MEGLMRYCITWKVNGKISQKLFIGNNKYEAIQWLSGYLMAMLDHCDTVELDDVVITELND